MRMGGDKPRPYVVSATTDTSPSVLFLPLEKVSERERAQRVRRASGGSPSVSVLRVISLYIICADCGNVCWVSAT
jgi:hypothetical protein